MYPASICCDDLRYPVTNGMTGGNRRLAWIVEFLRKTWPIWRIRWINFQYMRV